MGYALAGDSKVARAFRRAGKGTGWQGGMGRDGRVCVADRGSVGEGRMCGAHFVGKAGR